MIGHIKNSKREKLRHNSIFRKNGVDNKISIQDVFRRISSKMKKGNSKSVPSLERQLSLTWTSSEDSCTTRISSEDSSTPRTLFEDSCKTLSPSLSQKGEYRTHSHLFFSCQILQASHTLDEIERLEENHSLEIAELKVEIDSLQRAMKELDFQRKREGNVLYDEYELEVILGKKKVSASGTAIRIR
jgi:hypothetical protein